MRQTLAVFGVAGILTAGFAGSQTPRPSAGVALADLSWPDAEPYLTASSVVVIPLGAGAARAGAAPETEQRRAPGPVPRVTRAGRRRPWSWRRLMTYGFHPEFAEYPGTASLAQATARTLTVDVVRGLAKHGPRRFYVLNTERVGAGAAVRRREDPRRRRHPPRLHRSGLSPAAASRAVEAAAAARRARRRGRDVDDALRRSRGGGHDARRARVRQRHRRPHQERRGARRGVEVGRPRRSDAARRARRARSWSRRCSRARSKTSKPSDTRPCRWPGQSPAGPRPCHRRARCRPIESSGRPAAPPDRSATSG